MHTTERRICGRCGRHCYPDEFRNKTDSICRDCKREWQSQYLQRNRNAAIARQRAKRAYRSGRIKRKLACESCQDKKAPLEMHHNDYSKPLEVRWLCVSCHKEWHQKNGKGANGSAPPSKTKALETSGARALNRFGADAPKKRY